MSTKKFIFPLFIIFSIQSLAQSLTLDWAHSISQIQGTNVQCSDVAVDSSGNTYFTGSFFGTIDFDPDTLSTFNLTALSSRDIYVLKLDTSGNFLWAKQMGGPGADGSTSIVADDSGYVYITGGFSDTADFDPGNNTYDLKSKGLGDIFVVKLDASGEFTWAKQMGGARDDIGKSVSIDKFGNPHITGHFRDTADFDPSSSVYNLTSGFFREDIFIAKLNKSGGLMWAKQLEGKAGNSNSTSMAIDESGNVYTTGFYQDTVDFDPGSGVFSKASVLGQPDLFLLKLNSSGNFEWVKTIESIHHEIFNSIKISPSGYLYLAGEFAHDSIDANPNSGIHMLYNHDPSAIHDHRDIFISKLDTSGNFIWAKNIGNLRDGQRCTSIALDTSENIYIAGSFSGKLDFDPGKDTFYLTSSSNVHSDIYIAKLDSSGDLKWVEQFGSQSSGGGNSVIEMKTDSKGGVYVTGHINARTDFDPSNQSYWVNRGLFFLKMTDNLTAVNLAENNFPHQTLNDFKLYPNPSSNIIYIESDETFESIVIYDLHGAIVLRENASSFSVAGLKPGLYELQLHTKKGVLSKPFIKN